MNRIALPVLLALALLAFATSATAANRENTATASPVIEVKQGRAHVKLSCSSAGPCQGTVQLIAISPQKGGKVKLSTIAEATFEMAGASQATVRPKLVEPANRLLAKAGVIKAKLTGVHLTAEKVEVVRSAAK